MFEKYFKGLYSQKYQKTRLNGYVYDFYVDYNIINVNDVINFINIRWKRIK